MDFSKHKSLLKTCTLGWLAFVMVGWPDYYKSWLFENLLYFCIAVYFSLGFLIYGMINGYDGNKLTRSLK